VVDYVEVTGRGTAQVTPDVVRARLGAETVADDVAEAFAGAHRANEAMVAELRSAGVADADLRTSGMTVGREFGREGEPAGYRAGVHLDVVLRDVAGAGAQLGRALSAAGDAGRLSHLELALAAPQQALTTARAMAWQDARARAEQLARLSERQLGAVLQVVEGSRDDVGPFAARQQGIALAAAVEPGEVEVSGQVTVRWQLV
jgi:uncharacterized protein YggE